jgi:DNA polymerase I-like protein with 3'-5' exonuclease and polymerase domains
MQNIPARDEKHGQKTYGQEMRTLFLADEGCMIGAFDYSAIEAVLLAHYAKGQQADWFRQQIINGADYHKIVMEMTGIPNRDIIKRMNYGFIYGMGINKLISINRRLFKKLASEADMEMKAYGKQLHSIYHTKFPVIKDTMAWAQAVTKQNGSIMSIGGRVHHKPRPVYEDGRWNDGLYRMTNYLIQGSAAEILKKGLVKGWKDGVFNVLKLHLTVHDENVPSIPYNMLGVEAALHFQHECMETAYADRLLVPLKVVGEVGPNWGWWKGDIWEDMQKGIFNRDLITGEVIC